MPNSCVNVTFMLHEMFKCLCNIDLLYVFFLGISSLVLWRASCSLPQHCSANVNSILSNLILLSRSAGQMWAGWRRWSWNWSRLWSGLWGTLRPSPAWGSSHLKESCSTVPQAAPRPWSPRPWLMKVASTSWLLKWVLKQSISFLCVNVMKNLFFLVCTKRVNFPAFIHDYEQMMYHRCASSCHILVEWSAKTLLYDSVRKQWGS